MKKASIISIGNEVLSGETVDTNSAYLSKELLGFGIPVISTHVVGDDIKAIVKTLKRAAEDADIILTTGGLGPTDDDLTRQGLGEFLGVDLQFRQELVDRIQDYFAKRNLRMSPRNKVQAFMPAGTSALENNLGTAPGIMAEKEGKVIFALPGVPAEMKDMFTNVLSERLKNISSKEAVVIRKLKCFGEGESNIAEKLGDLMQRGRNPLINCTVEYGVKTLHIIATANEENQARQMAEKDEKLIRDLLGELVYGTDEQSLAEVVGQKLAQERKTIAVAESCTGGNLAKMLTDIPGASKYFTQGWVTYSDSAKISLLGVSADLIERYGAVSEEVARAMAVGARKNAKTDYAIGITGIAGPTGGTKQKPVGLVYIALDSDRDCEVKRFIFSQGRNFVRYRTSLAALNMLRLML